MMYSGKETAVNRPLVIQGLPWWLSGNKSTCQMKEMGVLSLSQQDPLEEEMAPPSSIPTWEFPMERRALWAAVHGVTRVRYYLTVINNKCGVQCGEVGSILESYD